MGAGETHDKERNPSHYVDLADDGSVMGVLLFNKVLKTREGYDTALRANALRSRPLPTVARTCGAINC